MPTTDLGPAAARTAALVAAVRDDQLDDPTPCTEWTVAQVLFRRVHRRELQQECQLVEEFRRGARVLRGQRRDPGHLRRGRRRGGAGERR